MRENIGIDLLATGEFLVVGDTERLIAAELARAVVATGRKLLIKIEAISANTIDQKDTHFLSWDASGEVLEVGPDVKRYQVGDKVFFPGDFIIMSRKNPEQQLLDERLVGKMPMGSHKEPDIQSSVNNVSAWGILFNHFDISHSGKDKDKTLLIVGGEGHIGARLIDLAKNQAGLVVIATAARSRNKAWLEQLGADHVVNHHNDLDSELEKINVSQLDYVVCLNSSEKYSYMLKGDT